MTEQALPLALALGHVRLAQTLHSSLVLNQVTEKTNKHTNTVRKVRVLSLACLHEPTSQEGANVESNIFQKIDAHLQNHRMGAWTGTFRDYLELVITAADPGPAGPRPAV